jgi:hypothetical protein
MEAKQVRILIDSMYTIDVNSKLTSISGVTATLQRKYGETITYEMIYTALLTEPHAISFRLDYPGCKLKKR